MFQVGAGKREIILGKKAKLQYYNTKMGMITIKIPGCPSHGN